MLCGFLWFCKLTILSLEKVPSSGNITEDKNTGLLIVVWRNQLPKAIEHLGSHYDQGLGPTINGKDKVAVLSM